MQQITWCKMHYFEFTTILTIVKKLCTHYCMTIQLVGPIVKFCID